MTITFQDDDPMYEGNFDPKRFYQYQMDNPIRIPPPHPMAVEPLTESDITETTSETTQ